jgi:hypothetical protein
MASTPKLERVVSDTERSIHEKKDVVMQKIERENENLELPDSAKHPGGGLPPTEALKRFFDRIPLFSVPGIGNAGGELYPRHPLHPFSINMSTSGISVTEF